MTALIVNLFGGPGAGKSTAATGVFYKLKLQGYNVEYVHEYAKGVVWEKSFGKLNNQLYIFGQQHQRQFRCSDQVDIVITDSPIILGMVYADEYGCLSKPLEELIRHEFRNQTNLNVVLQRNHAYDEAGRYQNEEEAHKIDRKIYETLALDDHPYHVIETGEDLCDNIITLIKQAVPTQG
jgi:nicotinamide riboside kinase